MRTMAYPNCCGKTCIIGFGQNPTQMDPDNPRQTYRQSLERILGGRGNAEYEVALNGTQNREWEPVLVGLGFSKVAEHHNPVHGSVIHTYYIARDLVLFGNREQPEQVPLPPAANPAQANVAADLAGMIVGQQYLPATRIREVAVGTPVEMRDNGGNATTMQVGQRGRVVGYGHDTLTVEYQCPRRGRRTGAYYPWRLAPLLPNPNAAAQPAPVEWAVGDRVRVLPTAGNYNLQHVGRVGVIDQIMGQNHRWAYVRMDGVERRTSFWFNDLERVVEVVAVAEPVPVAAPVQLIEYFANLRDVGRRGPFNGLEEARAAYPRCRRFDRRILVMAPGAIADNLVWEENVQDQLPVDEQAAAA